MTDDLVKRLRQSSSSDYSCQGCMDTEREEAADRIEKLEKYQSVHAQCDKTSLELEEKLVKQLSEARKRIQVLKGWLNGSLNIIEAFVAADTKDARKALEGKDD